MATAEQAAASAAWLAANRPDLVSQQATTAEQAAATNAAYLANKLPVLPKMGTSSAPGSENDLTRVYVGGSADVQGTPMDLTRSQYIQMYGRTPEASEAAKHFEHFDPAGYYGTTMAEMQGMSLSQVASRYGARAADFVQDYSRTHPSAAYLAITKQYAAMKDSGYTVTGGGTGYFQGSVAPYDPSGDVGISGRAAQQYGKSSFTTTPTLSSLGQELKHSAIYGQESTTERISTVPTFSAGEMQTVAGRTFFVPYGERTQQAVENAKAVFDPIGGRIGIYQSPASIYENAGFKRIYGWETSSGSTGALQSGMFSIDRPLTADVRTQWSPETYSTFAQPLKAALIRASPQDYSRLGAEVTGGLVANIAGGVRLEPGTQMGRYAPETGNLANLVDPYGVNRPKSELLATEPWKIDWASSPVLQTMASAPGSMVTTLSALPEAAYAKVGMAPPTSAVTGLPTRIEPIQANLGTTKNGLTITSVGGKFAGSGIPAAAVWAYSTAPEKTTGSETEYTQRGFMGLGGLLPEGLDQAHFQAWATASKSRPLEASAELVKSPLGPGLSIAQGVASRMTFVLSELAPGMKPTPIEKTPASTTEFPSLTTEALPTTTTVSGGSQEITDLGKWLTTNRDKIDRTDAAAVNEYNIKATRYNLLQEQNPITITTTGGTKTTKTTTTVTTPGENYASEWDKFVEGSGRVGRWLTGQTVAKQQAYYETIKGEGGLLGEAKRGLFFIGTETINKPAELAPMALTGALTMGAGEVIPGALAVVGTGTGRAAAGARFLTSPGGASLAKAGLAAVFGGAYTYGVTEGLTATPEKTKENIYRTVPGLVAMGGGGGMFNWLGETRIVSGSVPSGATVRGVAIGDQFFGGGKTPEGRSYVAAGRGGSEADSFMFTFGRGRGGAAGAAPEAPRGPTSGGGAAALAEPTRLLGSGKPVTATATTVPSVARYDPTAPPTAATRAMYDMSWGGSAQTGRTFKTIDELPEVAPGNIRIVHQTSASALETTEPFIVSGGLKYKNTIDTTSTVLGPAGGWRQPLENVMAFGRNAGNISRYGDTFTIFDVKASDYRAMRDVSKSPVNSEGIGFTGSGTYVGRIELSHFGPSKPQASAYRMQYDVMGIDKPLRIEPAQPRKALTAGERTLGELFPEQAAKHAGEAGYDFSPRVKTFSEIGTSRQKEVKFGEVIRIPSAHEQPYTERGLAGAREWEASRITRRQEYFAGIHGETGEVLFEFRGGKQSVNIGRPEIQSAIESAKKTAGDKLIYTHIHPYEAEGINAGFSPADFGAFAHTNMPVFRAITKYHEFEIRPKEGKTPRDMYVDSSYAELVRRRIYLQGAIGELKEAERMPYPKGISNKGSNVLTHKAIDIFNQQVALATDIQWTKQERPLGATEAAGRLRTKMREMARSGKFSPSYESEPLPHKPTRAEIVAQRKKELFSPWEDIISSPVERIQLTTRGKAPELVEKRMPNVSDVVFTSGRPLGAIELKGTKKYQYIGANAEKIAGAETPFYVGKTAHADIPAHYKQLYKMATLDTRIEYYSVREAATGKTLKFGEGERGRVELTDIRDFVIRREGLGEDRIFAHTHPGYPYTETGRSARLYEVPSPSDISSAYLMKAKQSEIVSPSGVTVIRLPSDVMGMERLEAINVGKAQERKLAASLQYRKSKARDNIEYTAAARKIYDRFQEATGVEIEYPGARKIAANTEKIPTAEGMLTPYEISAAPAGYRPPKNVLPDTMKHPILYDAAVTQYHTRLLAKEPSGKIVGAMAYDLETPAGKTHPENIYINFVGSTRGGVGGALVGKVKEIGARQGITSLTGRSVPESVGFWKKMGADVAKKPEGGLYDFRIPLEEGPRLEANVERIPLTTKAKPPALVEQRMPNISQEVFTSGRPLGAIELKGGRYQYIETPTERIVSEPLAVAKKKSTGGYSTEQMRMAWEMRKVPYGHGTPKSWSTPDPTDFLYRKGTTPMAGGEVSPGYPAIPGFTPKTGLMKVFESKTPAFAIHEVSPTFSVANTRLLSEYGSGRISPTNVRGRMEHTPGMPSNVFRPKKESPLVRQRAPATVRGEGGIFKVAHTKEAKTEGGGAPAGYYSGGNGTGVVLDISKGGTRLSRQKEMQRFVDSLIFSSGVSYERAALAPTSGVELLGPLQRRKYMPPEYAEEIYVGGIPGVPAPQRPVHPALREEQSRAITPRQRAGELARRMAEEQGLREVPRTRSEIAERINRRGELTERMRRPTGLTIPRFRSDIVGASRERAISTRTTEASRAMSIERAMRTDLMTTQRVGRIAITEQTTRQTTRQTTGQEQQQRQFIDTTTKETPWIKPIQIITPIPTIPPISLGGGGGSAGGGGGLRGFGAMRELIATRSLISGFAGGDIYAQRARYVRQPSRVVVVRRKK